MNEEPRVTELLVGAAAGGPLSADGRITFAKASHLDDPDDAARHLRAVFSALSANDAVREFWTRTGLDSFDPDRFFLNLRRLAETGDGPEILGVAADNAESAKRLSALLAGSQLLTDVCVRRPSFLWEAINPAYLRTPDDLPDAALEIARFAPIESDAGHAGEGAFAEGLAAYRMRETLRIVLADLLGYWDTAAVLAHISDVASTCIGHALSFCESTLVRRHGEPRNDDEEMPGEPADFFVLGMGKLGGRELNFSSDIDLIYVYRTERGRTAGGSAASVSNPEFFATLARDVTRVLGTDTPEGPLYRVDLRLRPSGQSGDVAIGLRSAETYYEYWGETWERQALIRGRRVAGSASLEQAFFERLHPFLWPRSIDYSAIESLRLSKRRIEEGVTARRGNRFDVKLSRGGIREVEFVVQAFQLIYGGKDPSLRRHGTIETLDAIVAKGLMPESDAEGLRAAYLFLRDLENRVQFLEGRQTHVVMPDQEPALARKLGLDRANRAESVNALRKEIEKHRRHVMAVFEQMFPEPEDPSIRSGREQRRTTPRLGAHDEDRDAVMELLSQNGFVRPEDAYANLVRVRDGDASHPVTAAAKELFAVILADLIETAGRLPDPDLAIGNLERFVLAMGSRRALFQTLADSGEWLESLLALLGSSEYLSTVLISQPDFLESTFRPEYLSRAKRADDITDEFRTQLAGAGGYDSVIRELRRIKRAEELRIGLRNVLGRIGVRETMAELTALADGTIAVALELARARVATKAESPDAARVPFAVFALGSHGAGELVFNSDLDLLYLYRDADEEEEAARRRSAATHLAEAVNAILASNLDNGFAYRVDLRLRPEGVHGALCAPAGGLDRYLQTRASVWELQSLLRLRPVAGDAEVIDRVLETVDASLRRLSETRPPVQEVAKMRERMEAERSKKGARYVDLKVGRGGLVDAEFAVQLLALSTTRGSVPRGGSTLDLLAMLETEGHVSAAEARALREGFVFLKRLENQVRLTFERPLTHIDTEGDRLGLIARLLGYRAPPEGPALLSDLERHRGALRKVYEGVVARLIDAARV